MKLNLLLLTFVAFLKGFLVFGQVTLPHHDAISYTAGQTLQSQEGWTFLNSGDDISITAGSLSYTNLPTSAGNKISFDGSGIDAAKLFTQQTSGTVYYSFLFNVTALGTLNNTTGGYFTSYTEGSSTSYGGGVWTRSNGTGFDIGLSARTTAANTVWSAGGAFPLNTTILVVVSYQLVAGASNDIVKLWINPALGAAEPTPTLTVTNTAGIDLVNLNRLLVRQDSANNTPSINMDELRVGITWESVTPSSSLGLNSNAAIENNVTLAATNNQVTANTTKNAISNIAVYDLAGKLLFEQNAIDSNNYTTPKLNVAKQLLIVKLTLKNGVVISKKLMF